MINTECIRTTSDAITLGSGRAVNPYEDPEIVRLTALNLELAIRNLVNSSCAPKNLVLTADLTSHFLMATHLPDGEVKVVVYKQ